jgi:hypothetical protein
MDLIVPTIGIILKRLEKNLLPAATLEERYA